MTFYIAWIKLEPGSIVFIGVPKPERDTRNKRIKTTVGSWRNILWPSFQPQSISLPPGNFSCNSDVLIVFPPSQSPDFHAHVHTCSWFSHQPLLYNPACSHCSLPGPCCYHILAILPTYSCFPVPVPVIVYLFRPAACPWPVLPQWTCLPWLWLSFCSMWAFSSTIFVLFCFQVSLPVPPMQVCQECWNELVYLYSNSIK